MFCFAFVFFFLLVGAGVRVGGESEYEYGGAVTWDTRRSLAEGTVQNSSLILAEKRTYRKDPLDGFKKYTGGWNISNDHYWAVSSLNP